MSKRPWASVHALYGVLCLALGLAAALLFLIPSLNARPLWLLTAGPAFLFNIVAYGLHRKPSWGSWSTTAATVSCFVLYFGLLFAPAYLACLRPARSGDLSRPNPGRNPVLPLALHFLLFILMVFVMRAS